jgi:hypothetical protein
MTGDLATLEAVDGESEEPAYRQVGPVRIRRDASFGPIALILVSLIGIFAVFWGELFADPGIEVTLFDAGAVDDHAIGVVVVFEQLDLYVIGLEDGRVRAVDGRLDNSSCTVSYLPDDPRGRSRNPTGASGVLEDPCGDGVWALTGDAISGTNEPLRTPQVTFLRADDGLLHVWVEIIAPAVTTGE